MVVVLYLWLFFFFGNICGIKKTRYLCRVKTRTNVMKKYICTVCSYVYDPAVGDPDSGIAPGTAFEDLPADWVCPLCGVGKDDFEPVEE